MSIPVSDRPDVAKQSRRALTKAQAHSKLQVGDEFRINFFRGTRLARVIEFDREGLPVVETLNVVDGVWKRKTRSIGPRDIRAAFGCTWRV